MDLEERLTANFSCAKCRGKSAVTKTVTLKNRGLPAAINELISHGADKYVLLTCTLCGYTELYSVAAYVNSEEPAEAANPVVQEN